MATDICIRGAGVVGRSLALLLSRAGFSVVLAGARGNEGQGSNDPRSYALNAASRRLLTELRVWPQGATTVRGMHIWADGESVLSFSPRDEALAWIVDAQELMCNLSQAAQFAPGLHCVEAHSQVDSALEVICEGRSSPFLEAAQVGLEKHSYPQSAVVARLVCDLPHGAIARQWMTTQRVCALLPRAADQADNAVSLVWSVPHEQAVALQRMDPREFEEHVRTETHNTVGAIRLQGEPAERVVWPLSLSQAQHWSGVQAGRAWVLVGDAAHTIHPLAGQGLNLGLADAVTLSNIVRSRPYFRQVGDARLLRQYERERKAQAAKMALATHGLQRLFGHSDPRLKWIRAFVFKATDRVTPLKHWLIQHAAGSA